MAILHLWIGGDLLFSSLYHILPITRTKLVKGTMSRS